MKTSKSNSIKASTIIQRLPIHQQLSKSQQLLSKISPIWLGWVTKNLPSELSNCYSPCHFGQGNLLIECTNAVAATQLQQRQQSLINYLNKQGLTQIQKITARLTNKPAHKQAASMPEGFRAAESSPPAEGSQTAEGSQIRSPQLTAKALSSIESCQKQVDHQPLSESLGRLIKSIQKK